MLSPWMYLVNIFKVFFCVCNQLPWAHRSSQRQSGSLYGSDLGPLHIWYGCVAWTSCETPSSGSGRYLWVFHLFYRPFSSYWVASSSFHMRFYSLLHLVMACLVDITWRPAFFQKGNQEGLVFCYAKYWLFPGDIVWPCLFPIPAKFILIGE